jgi:hypothetical protein
MQRPDIDIPILEPEKQFRCVGRTQNLEEANRISGRYQLEGFETKIITKSRGGLALYEIWVGKEPDVPASKGRV